MPCNCQTCPGPGRCACPTCQFNTTNSMNASTCDVSALGLSFFSSPTNYTVVANGRTINPGELFTNEFLTGRTRELVEAVVKNLNQGATVHADGSVTAMNASGSVFRTAPAGSVNVARYKQLYPNAGSVATAMGIPMAASPAVTATVLASQTAAPKPTAAQALDAGTPAPSSPTTSGGVNLADTLKTLLDVGAQIYGTTQERKIAEAQARTVTAQASLAASAVSNPVFAPPTAPAQGAAVNTAAAYGYGFGQSAPPAMPSLSLPALPALPLAPGVISNLPVSGPVMEPPTLSSVSPTTGLAVPSFPPSAPAPGGPLNAAALQQLMQPPPMPAPAGGGMPWKTVAVVAAVGLGLWLALGRRGRRRR